MGKVEKIFYLYMKKVLKKYCYLKKCCMFVGKEYCL